MIYENKEMFRDRILACWIGKNIGGTIGEPHEGKRELLDVTGFTTPPGEPLPNDDLDLQLAWLLALEMNGPEKLDSALLAEYWLSHIKPDWQEYGICKCNLKRGFLPPLSGEIGNQLWRNSNGAWIRFELRACLAPGFPGIARRYAFEDAIVDHGLGEVTLAEIFTATMQSEAFEKTDIRALIEKALCQIPEESLLARSVKLTLDCFDAGLSWQETRERVLALSLDEIGWFMAPANIAFVVIGLLWGGGDFKKSILIAVNCGDDTDCTGGTVGATLGIMKGTAGIPSELREYVGDRILWKSLNGEYRGLYAHSCEELTDRVMAQIDRVLAANRADKAERTKIGAGGKTLAGRGRMSVAVDSAWAVGRLTYEKEPLLSDGEELSLKFELRAKDYTFGPNWVECGLMLPEGWSGECPRSRMLYWNRRDEKFVLDIKIKAVKPGFSNTVVLWLRADEHAGTITVPITIGGK